jgi:hypothetical protein
MITSRAQTYQRRDLLTELIDGDDAKIAEKLLVLFVETDQRTAAGCAARDDTMRFLHSFTEDAKRSLERFVREKSSLLAAVFITASLYVIG